MRAPIAMLLAAVAAPAAVASVTDLVTIGVSLNTAAQSDFTDVTRFSRLRGQSVYFSNRTNGGTTGGQLDGVDSRDTEFGVLEITFGEAFPEANLTDYLTFGYFGVVETYELATNELGELDAVLVDTSIILGVNGDAAGLTLDGFLGFSEAELLAALTGSFDSMEFFAALGAAANDPRLQANIGLFQAVPGEFAEPVRPGGSLTLYAFVDGDDGDLAREVGFIDTTVLRVIPAPMSAATLALAGVVAARRRRG